MCRAGPERRRRRTSGGIALALLLLGAVPAAALEQDRNQPIQIRADEAVRDEKQGFTLYEGNVEMEQGSLRIDADKIVIYHTARQTNKIVAEGRPARLQQKPQPDEEVVRAQAGIIEYFRQENRVLLRNSARIEQNGSTITGNSIDYFIGEQRVRARSGEAQDGERVQVVIPAESVEENEKGSGGESGATDSE
jgi:lipopolysaccharide export system protein LptA